MEIRCATVAAMLLVLIGISPVNAQDFCDQLDAVIKDWPSGFSTFRGAFVEEWENKKEKLKVKVYLSNRSLLGGNCSVVDDGINGNFRCYYTPENVGQVERTYEKFKKVVEKCLGADWSAERKQSGRLYKSAIIPQVGVHLMINETKGTIDLVLYQTEAALNP